MAASVRRKSKGMNVVRMFGSFSMDVISARGKVVVRGELPRTQRDFLAARRPDGRGGGGRRRRRRPCAIWVKKAAVRRIGSARGRRALGETSRTVTDPTRPCE